MKYLILFFTYIYFGLLCINGGGSLTQFYIDELVNGRHWMTLEEFGNFTAISQVTPGPIGVNIATFIGYDQGGLLGGLIATIALLLPSFFLMSLAVRYYGKWHDSNFVRSLMYGIRPVTTALILTALCAYLGMSLLNRQIPFDALLSWDWNAFRGLSVHWEMLPVLVFAIFFLSTRRLSIMCVIFSSAGMGIIIHWLSTIV